MPAGRCSSGPARDLKALFAREPQALLPVIAESCRIKAEIVEQDEHESGLRRTLNFGHTAGHALEAVTKYRRFRHGEAVAYGMLAAAALATKRGRVPGSGSRSARRATSCRWARCPPSATCRPAEVVEATRRDKKVLAGRLHFVLPTSIGATTTVTDVAPQELREALIGIGLKD